MKNGIVQLLTTMETKDTDSKEEFATTLSNLIETFVKSATVTVSAGIIVTTTGSATAQSGVTTSEGTGTIN